MVSSHSDGVSIYQDSGVYGVHTEAYDVSLSSDGCLTSIKAGGVELLDSIAGFARGSFFFQNDLVKLSDVRQLSDNVIAAESDAAAVRYEFSYKSILCAVTNSTTDPMTYQIILDGGVNVAADDEGSCVSTPMNCRWHPASFFKNDIRLRASGHSILQSSWNDLQSVQAVLAAGETRYIHLAVDKAGEDEQAKVAKALAPPTEADTYLMLVSPKEYQVFQRRSMYDGFIRVSGSIDSDFDSLQVRISGKSLKGDLPGNWQPVPFTSHTRSFVSEIPVVPGGWYTVELQALKDSEVVAQHRVDKVGVGEVFVGAGQSNSTNCGEEKISQTSGMVASFSGSYWQLANDPQPGVHDHYYEGGSFWPAFGDAMYEKYQVPIGVAVTGHGGTSATMWQPDKPDGLFEWMMTRIHQLGTLGFRAVLWHQGESDVDKPSELYVAKMTNIIRKSTMLAGWEFPWFVALASYWNAEKLSCPLVRRAQQKLWELGIAIEGPDTDTLTGDHRDFNGTGIHFSPKGLRAHGKMWAEKVGTYLDKVLEESDV